MFTFVCVQHYYLCKQSTIIRILLKPK